MNEPITIAELIAYPSMKKRATHTSLLRAWCNHINVSESDPIYAVFPIQTLIWENGEAIATDLLAIFNQPYIRGNTFITYYSPTTIAKLLEVFRFVAQRMEWCNVRYNCYHLEMFERILSNPSQPKMVDCRTFIYNTLELLKSQIKLQKAGKPIRVFAPNEYEKYQPRLSQDPLEGRLSYWPIPEPYNASAYVRLYPEIFAGVS